MDGQILEQVDYERPEVVDYGDLAELTGGLSSGACLDADFPVGTKAAALTFSRC